MKVKCTKYNTDERYFTLGKIYEVRKDGSIKNDNGFVYKVASNMPLGDSPLQYLRRWYEFQVVDDNGWEIVAEEVKKEPAMTFDDFLEGAECAK